MTIYRQAPIGFSPRDAHARGDLVTDQEAQNEFVAVWRRFYPYARPLGHLIRHARKNPWVRFHALPDSKRYADTEREREIILSRANTLAGELFGTGKAVWLIQTCFENPFDSGPSGAVRSEGPFWNNREHPFWACREYALPQVDSFHDDEVDWFVHARLMDWRPGAFDRLFGLIADDEATDTLWMSPETGAVLAPYDGGFDLFMPTDEDVLAMKSTYEAWLSSHPQGL